MTQKKKLFFPNLDGVRAIAATLVVIWHTELHKNGYVTSNIHIPDLGHMGVSIFLGLSGFLITYLLMEERDTAGTIDYRNFYLRRILRIWPLYFLVLLFGYFVFPRTLSAEGLWLSVFFLPNIAILLKLLPTVIDPIWSIGVEEQFYLVQPHLLRIKKPKTILNVLIILLVGIYGLKFGLKLMHQTPAVAFLTECIRLFRYDCLVMGSIGAILLYNYRHRLFTVPFSLNIIFSKWVQAACLLFYLAYFAFKMRYPELLNNELLSICTVILILNLCNPETSVLSFQNKVFSYLGKISYGIYLMHKFPLVLILWILHTYYPDCPEPLASIIIYAFTYGSVVILATLSYNWYESYFLKLKNRYAKIVKQ